MHHFLIFFYHKVPTFKVKPTLPGGFLVCLVTLIALVGLVVLVDLVAVVEWHALFWPKIGHWEKSPNLGANYAPGL